MVLTFGVIDFQHELCKMMLDNKLHIAPIVENPKHVLDVATGTGIWAIDFGTISYIPFHIFL
jgi:ubiquinone/menaquinone biosynthesis C-methylase UbiE